MIYTITQKLLLATCFLSTLGSFAQTKTNMQKEKNQHFTTEQKAVLSTIEKMNVAFHNKDIEGVMASYEANATVVFEPEQAESDAVQIREMFLRTFSVNPQFTFTGHEVFITGEIATHITPWHMTGTAPDGSKIEQSGLSVAILRKQKDGSWLMILDNPHAQFLMNH